jgi:hypothetical protein
MSTEETPYRGCRRIGVGAVASLPSLTGFAFGLFGDWGFKWLPPLIHVSEYFKFLETLKTNRAIGA